MSPRLARRRREVLRVPAEGHVQLLAGGGDVEPGEGVGLGGGDGGGVEGEGRAVEEGGEGEGAGVERERWGGGGRVTGGGGMLTWCVVLGWGIVGGEETCVVKAGDHFCGWLGFWGFGWKG